MQMNLLGIPVPDTVGTMVTKTKSPKSENFPFTREDS